MLYGNGYNITGVVASSANAETLTGTYINAGVTGSSLTSLGTMNNITMGGANSISGGNLLSANYVTGTLTTAAQPNITSLGNLTAANVTGNLQAGGILTDNLYYANGGVWDLQQAAGDTSEIQFNNGDNFAASANFTFNSGSSTLTVTGTGNITTVNATTVTATTGNITTVNATTGNITTVNGTTGNITTVNATTVTATTGNITTVNTTDIVASGNANITGWLKAADTVITGNLTVTGTTTSVNTTTSQLTDPLLDLGNGANGAALTTNDAFDRGLVMHTRVAGTNKDLFMGWDTSNAEFVMAKNVTVSDNVVTVPGTTDAEKLANLADLRLANIYAYNANFGGVVFSQGNVTLGAGSFLNGNVNGNISGTITVTGGNGAIQFANATNAMTSSSNLNFNDSLARLTLGNGTTTGELKANVVTASYVAGTLTTASQPNVTSVGTLTSLDVTNAVTAGSFKSDTYQYANGSPIDFQTAAGSATQIQFKSSSGNDLDASANLTFNSSTSNLTVNGNIITGAGSGGNISGANVVSATLFSGSGANLTNINGANVSEVALATNVTASAQGNITSVGTLTGLTIVANGDITLSGVDSNISGANLISAGYFSGNGSALTGVTATSMNAANLTGSTLSSNVTGSSLTSVGTLTSLTVTGSITSSTGDLVATLGNVSGNVITGTTLTGTLSTAAQPNITSVGTLTSLTVANTGGSGNITADNVFANAGIVSGQYLYGNGINISNIAGANVSGYVQNANIANVAYAVAAGNITGTTLNSNIVTSSLTTVGTLGSLSVTATITAGNVLASNIGNATTILRGDGANITGVTASAIDAGNLTGQTLSSNVIYSSLTSVGTLSGLTSNGTVNFTTASNVSLGPVANVHITGGTTGQYLQTDGSGTLSWSTVSLSNINNGTSNVSVANNGNVTAAIAGSNVITIATAGLTVTGIIEATGNILGNNITSNNFITANGTTAATSAATGAIKSEGGISAKGNIYTGDALGFAHGSGNTDSAAYIKYNATAGSIDFIFN